MKRIVAVVLALAALLSAFGVASAHAKLDHCTPAVGSTVATAPSQIVCVMSEEIDTKQSTMSVFDAGGAQVDKKDAHVDLNDPDHKTLLVSLDSTLVKNGTYTVKYHTVTPDDGGVTDDSFTFSVGTAAPAAQATTAATAAATAIPTAAATVAPTSTTGAGAQATATSPAPSTLPTTGGIGLTRSALIDLGLFLAFSLLAIGMLMQRHTR